LALRPAWSRYLEFWPLVLLGDASYSFYLLHSNLIGMVFQPTGEPLHLPLWKLIAGLAVPIAVSIAAFKWIESPAQRKLLGKKERELKAAPAPATA
jgi:peptidoglycan/LPS O-acetylase OafA/YrhL